MRFVFFMLLALPLLASAEPVPHPEWHVHDRGFGQVHLGMTVLDASLALGRDITKPEMRGVESEECSSYFFGTRKPLTGVRFLVTSGVVRRIDIWTPNILTERGIGVGSTIDQVRVAYPNLKEFIGHYQDQQASSALSQDVEVRFSFGSKGVATYWIGLRPEVNYIEGCL